MGGLSGTCYEGFTLMLDEVFGGVLVQISNLDIGLLKLLIDS